jgi:hypothetical protein
MTVASRIMLPTYVIVFTWIGGGWLLTPIDRLRATPGLAYLDDIVGLRAVSLLLLAAGLLIAAALVTGRRIVARYALTLAGFCFGLLFVALFAAPFFSDTSPAAGAWPFLGLAACRATYKSVTAYEVS